MRLHVTVTRNRRILLDWLRLLLTYRLQGQLVQLREKHTKLVPEAEQLNNEHQAHAAAIATSKLMQEDQMSGLQAQASHSTTSLQSLLD